MRWRAPKAKPGQLVARYGKVEGCEDLCYAHGAGVDRSDARLLHSVLSNERFYPSRSGPLGTYRTERSFADELEARGYDITTLRFSIEKKRPASEAHKEGRE